MNRHARPLESRAAVSKRMPGDLLKNLPWPGGRAAALDSVGGQAAPLLAGFAAVLIGLLLEEKIHIWAKDATLLVLVAAVLSLIAAVQCIFTARQFFIPPHEYEALLAISDRDEIPPQ